ncbi:G-protein coupled receptor moody-like isoform X2 [Thrips palmi]|uniref:G-protein coupled receptor moody-like isoform X2 n=1 Tax=Thrips palmi TaxID=161013 RepID=A0A6P8YDQ0_THRPL|nr:G-protein coupled receptor moody-like isoform X2 [Thrips palmi]XP_034231927.1 G-protein coupled receptor moody-like isoform X2 [Thrips palmi]
MEEPVGPMASLALVEAMRRGAFPPAPAAVNNYDSELSRFSRPMLTMAAVLTILVMILGVAGNLLTIVALLRCPRVRNVAAAFIISLCVADLLFCVTVLPFSASRFIHGTWTHGGALCTVVPFMRYGNVGVSLLSIAMITINRYIMIAHYNIYGRVYRTGWIAAMIVFCWLFSYGFQLPTLAGVWGVFGFDKQLGTCSIRPDAAGRSSKTALFVTAFVVPCIIIIGCYARIFWVVHESEKRMRAHGARSAGTGPLAAPKQGREGREQRAKRNEWRITKMVLAIFLSFLCCYLPITIVKVTDHNVRYPGLHVTGYLLLYLSACINPIIYVIMNAQYRQAYRSVLTCHRQRHRMTASTAGPAANGHNGHASGDGGGG